MSTRTTSLPPTQAQIVLSYSGYIMVWVIMLLFQIASAVFLVGQAYIYVHFADEDSLLGYLAYNYLFAESMVFITQHHQLVGIGYAIISVPFIYGSARMIAYSMWRRRLAFGPDQANEVTDYLHTTLQKRQTKSKRWLSARGLYSLISFRGAYYDQTMLFAESLELVLQTIQDYGFSKYNSSLAINQVYGVMIFLNALSSPLIHYWFDRPSVNHLQRRLYCVLADMALDFTWGIIIPLAMFAPFWRSYWHRATGVDFFGLQWESRDRKLRQVLVGSTSNFVMSVFPFLSSAHLYHKLHSILVGTQRRQKQSSTMPLTSFMPTLKLIPSIKLKPANPVPETNDCDTSSPLRVTGATNVYMMLMVAYGVFILVVSIIASGVFFPTDTSGINCADRLYPWFWQPLTCVGRGINCDSLGIRGRKDELHHVFHNLDPFLIGKLKIHNCNDLEIPANIRQYNDLVTLMVENSTIIEWNADASLIDPIFGQLQTLMLTDVHVVGIPDGFTKNRLPQAFEWIFFTRVNVYEFIDKISDDVWSDIWVVVFDDCQLSHIPSVVATMPNLLSLIIRNNPIISAELEDFNMNDGLLLLVNLDNTSVKELSNGTWEFYAKQLTTLSIQSTNISSIPEHIHEIVNPLLTVRAYGTPLCAAMQTSSVQPLPWVECEYIFDW